MSIKSHPENEGRENINWHGIPMLPGLRCNASFSLRGPHHLYKFFQRQEPILLHTVKIVYKVGLHVGVLGRPTFMLCVSSTESQVSDMKLEILNKHQDQPKKNLKMNLTC